MREQGWGFTPETAEAIVFLFENSSASALPVEVSDVVFAAYDYLRFSQQLEIA